jgi:ribosomal protein S18 acetylase RimI-like enzyme
VSARRRGAAGAARPVRGASLRFRARPRPQDVAAVRGLAAAVGVFTRAEQAVAAELVDARVRGGSKSGYFFTFADVGGAVVGSTAWGPIPMTADGYDLYWIIVDPAHQRGGLGRRLLDLTEDAVYRRGGRRLYVETSSRERYARTRRFYRRAAYRQVARLADFYSRGDDKIVYCKTLGTEARGR